MLPVRDAIAAGLARVGQVTPKLLRHSFATIAFNMGLDMDTARRIMRHTDETMLREVYCRPSAADLVPKVAMFAALEMVDDEDDDIEDEGDIEDAIEVEIDDDLVDGEDENPWLALAGK